MLHVGSRICSVRHLKNLRNIINIYEGQRSNGVTRRNLVFEWCGALSSNQAKETIYNSALQIIIIVQ